MDRLTMTSDKGGLAFTFDLDITCEKSEIDKIVRIGQRLKAYEDTGLEPEEIIDGKMLTGWIPVSEKLPEHLKVVLVTTHDEYTQLAYCKHDGWHLLFNGWLFVSSPLAWMPLPEPYKQN